MGGNAKYRSHTAVIRNPHNESGFQAMRDANGNLIRIPESERVVGKNKRTANLANAKERMLNAKALKEVRDLAKSLRKAFDVGNPNGRFTNQYRSDFRKIANLANQIQPKSVSDLALTYPNLVSTDELNNIEKALGVKLT